MKQFIIKKLFILLVSNCLFMIKTSAFLEESSTSNLFERNAQATSARETEQQQQQQNRQQEMLTIHEREFKSSLVKIQMECKRDKTIIRLNFTQPFNGILGAGKLDTSECKLFGNGSKFYELQVQHNSTNCDTQWDNTTNSIFNTLFIRFHNSLETGSDIAKNVMCRLTVGDVIVGRRPTNKLSSSKQQQQTNLKHKLNSIISTDDMLSSTIETSVSPPISNLLNGISSNNNN